MTFWTKKILIAAPFYGVGLYLIDDLSIFIGVLCLASVVYIIGAKEND